MHPFLEMAVRVDVPTRRANCGSSNLYPKSHALFQSVQEENLENSMRRGRRTARVMKSETRRSISNRNHLGKTYSRHAKESQRSMAPPPRPLQITVFNSALATSPAGFLLASSRAQWPKRLNRRRSKSCRLDTARNNAISCRA